MNEAVADSARSTARQRVLWVLLAIVFLAPIALNIRDHLTRPRQLPDEKSAIIQLLAQKFTGPEYFQIESGTAAQNSSSDKVYLTVESAKKQIGRISAARKFDAEDTSRLNALISGMTEPPQSRVVGEERVNLLMLNLALDALK